MELRGICSWELVGANAFTLSNTATFLIPCYMGTLIKIRNVCLSYWKSGVLPFFQNIGRKKMELYGFFGNYSLKELYGFFGSYSKKWEIHGYSGKMLKKWSFSVFPCVVI